VYTRPAVRAAKLRGLLGEPTGLDTSVWPNVTVSLRERDLPALKAEALALEARDAIALLSACAGKEMLGSGISLGLDIAFWCDALRLSAELVAAQRFLPSLAYDAPAKDYRAVWEPVLGERERRLAAALAATMPSACEEIAPTKDATALASVLERFIGIAVDGLVRTPAATPVVSSGSEALHDRWVLALRSHDPVVSGTPAELHGLATQIEAWRRAVTDEHAESYRLCLRVEEPPDDGEGWHIAYLLQSRADPSLLIDTPEAMKRAGTRRTLLAALGRAREISPHVDASLASTSTPAGFDLNTGDVYRFLSETAWLFEQSGIGVILPAWWLGKETKSRLTTRARVNASRVKGGLRVDALLDVDWSVAIGDATLTTRELERLAKLKVPLVRVRGQWVHVEANELRAALARVQGGPARIPMGDLVRMQLESPSSVEAAGTIGDFLERLRDRAYEELPKPHGLQAELRPYQVRGYSWLRFLTAAGFGACLADDMGLGKTLQTLTLVLRDWRERPGGAVLLVCPTSVIGNWLREVRRFAPDLPVHIHHGAGRVRDAQFTSAAQTHALIITSFALLHRDADLFAPIAWRGVVLDEAQNIKNADSLQARAARRLQAGYRIALTGTPVENHVGDLWAIFEFLNRGLLGTRSSFQKEFLVPIQAMRNREAAERLKRLCAPFLLRRLKSDPGVIADLPEKNEMKVFCTLTREQGSLYAAVLRDLLGSIDEPDGIERRGKILALLSKLKQVCNHPAQFAKDRSAIAGRSGKLSRLEEMLEEVLATGERALVFTQFAEMGELLVRRLTERFAREVLFLHGGVPQGRRDEMVERFQSETGPSMFVLSLKAGGSGLNLTRANHVFHFDRWWNPAVENQATDRAYRIGQHKNVSVHKFVCAGTLEERIDELIERKRSIAEDVVGSGETWLTELSGRQLRELVALSAEAVEE
jgi:SNF2 family DNA or RNA helicase